MFPHFGAAFREMDARCFVLQMYGLKAFDLYASLSMFLAFAGEFAVRDGSSVRPERTGLTSTDAIKSRGFIHTLK